MTDTSELGAYRRAHIFLCYIICMSDVLRTDDEWKQKLSEEEYRVLREKGTEPAFSGALLEEKRGGIFKCAACKTPLFPSDAKFDSGTGWPSFDQALPGAVEFNHDDAYGMNRTEVVCATCKSHLGHVFSDGPTESGKRYCINSVCLGFDEKES